MTLPGDKPSEDLTLTPAEENKILAERLRNIAALEDYYGDPFWVFDDMNPGSFRYVAVSQEGGWSAGDFHPSRTLFFAADSEDDVFEILADEVLSGSVMEAVYDLNTAERIELHVTTPVVSRSEDQGTMENPLKPSQRCDKCGEFLSYISQDLMRSLHCHLISDDNEHLFLRSAGVTEDWKALRCNNQSCSEFGIDTGKEL